MSGITLIKASLSDYPTIQNMARFYVYDMSRYCGFISSLNFKVKESAPKLQTKFGKCILENGRYLLSLKIQKRFNSGAIQSLILLMVIIRKR